MRRLGLLVVLATLALAACGAGNHAEEFGKVTIPGHQTVTLDTGTYGVFYEETVNLEKYDSLNVPNGLLIEVTGKHGSPPAVFQRKYTGNHVTVNESTAREIGQLTITADGLYTVAVASNADAAERTSHHPAITIGPTYEAVDKKFTALFYIGGGLFLLYVLRDRIKSPWRRRST